MEPIEEQWNPSSSPDITSSLWMNITDIKKAVKTWLLNQGESQANSNQNNKNRLQLHCLLISCSFKIRIVRKKDLFRVTLYILYDYSPLTYIKFKLYNSVQYLASLIERDVAINRYIKPKEIREQAGLYY